MVLQSFDHAPFTRKIIFCICALASLMICIANAQGSNKDSVRAVLKNTKQDSSRVSTLLFLADELRNNDPEDAHRFAGEALQLSTRLNFKKGIGRANVLIGIAAGNLGRYNEGLKDIFTGLETAQSIGDSQAVSVAYNQVGSFSSIRGNYADAMNYFLQALRIQKVVKDKKELANCYSNIGDVYEKQGNHDTAMMNQLIALKLRKEAGDKSGTGDSYNYIGIIKRSQGEVSEAMQDFLTALEIQEEIGNTFGVAITQQNIAIVYVLQSNYSESEKYFRASLKSYEAIKNKLGIGVAYGNLGWCFGAQKKYDESFESTLKALKILEACDPKPLVAMYYNNIGCLHKEKGNYKDAMKYLMMGVKIFEEMGDRSNSAETYESIGETYSSMADYGKALTWLNKALNAADAINAKRVMQECYSALADVYEKSLDYKNAYRFRKLYSSMKESLEVESSRNVAAMKTQYETEKKDKEIQLMNKDKIIRENDAQRQKIIKNVFIGGFILVLLIVFALYKLYSDKRKANRMLESALQNLKATQVKLVQSEKMASLGQMTAGIAHEIKNPLNFVNNFADLSKGLVDDFLNAKSEEERNELADYLKKNLTKINEHGKRADSIVRNMLAHSRGKAGEMQLTDINQLCDEIFALAYHGMRATVPDFNCEMKKELAVALPKINIIPQDISRVLLNLFNNAFYAVKERRTKYKVQSTMIYQPQVLLSTKLLNNTIAISIRDNGIGIPGSIREKIFEPFFTTKPTGQGTGLGLSISYDIITKGHQGELKVESKEGEYTEFTIELPVD